MKIFAISDLHISSDNEKPMAIFGGNWVGYLEKIRTDWQQKVTDEDIVLVGGDISWSMTLDGARKDIEILTDLKGKKIFIRGNHDYWWHAIGRVRDMLPFGFYALQNDSIKFENVVICGSRGWTVPSSPDFTTQDLKLYNRETERLKISLKNARMLMAEGDKLIALIHFPPFSTKREDTAFTSLFEENGVDSVVYGHLHGTNIKMEKLIIKNDIKYYLTSCDQVDNKLTEIL